MFFHSTKCIWKSRLENRGHFVSALMRQANNDTRRHIFWCFYEGDSTLHWRHNGWDNVSNHQLHDCLLNRLFRRRSKKTSMLRITGLCVGNSPGTGEFPTQMASYAENVSIWWRHHENFVADSKPPQPRVAIKPRSDSRSALLRCWGLVCVNVWKLDIYFQMRIHIL